MVYLSHFAMKTISMSKPCGRSLRPRTQSLKKMAGLRSKAFTLKSAKREATNFYVWDSEGAAKAFFTEELLERVTGLYGMRPTVEFVQIATLVENVRT